MENTVPFSTPWVSSKRLKGSTWSRKYSIPRPVRPGQYSVDFPTAATDRNTCHIYYWGLKGKGYTVLWSLDLESMKEFATLELGRNLLLKKTKQKQSISKRCGMLKKSADTSYSFNLFFFKKKSCLCKV